MAKCPQIKNLCLEALVVSRNGGGSPSDNLFPSVTNTQTIWKLNSAIIGAGLAYEVELQRDRSL